MVQMKWKVSVHLYGMKVNAKTFVFTGNAVKYAKFKNRITKSLALNNITVRQIN